MSSVTVTELKRTFRHNGKDLPDPDPTATPERVIELLSLTYPELNNAVIDAPEAQNGRLVYKLKTNVGTKG